jgi:predicted aspartyl protease
MIEALVAALLSLPVVSSGAARTSAPVDLEIGDAGLITAPVTVNGQGPFVFLLDTGSNRSVVTGELAERLVLPTVARTVMVTPAGRQAQPVARIDELTMGGNHVRGILASVVPAVSLSTAGPAIDGIVGQDFLSGFDYTIDYRKRRLTWSATPGHDHGEVRLTLVKREGRFLVELPQAGRSVRLVPDSGAEDLVVFERRGSLPVALDEESAPSVLAGAAGNAPVRTMMLGRLQAGAVTFRHQRVLVVSRDEPDAPEGDGLLPLHLFRSVGFNGTEGYLLLRKQP